MLERLVTGWRRRRELRRLKEELTHGICGVKDWGRCGINGEPCRTLFFPESCPLLGNERRTG